MIADQLVGMVMSGIYTRPSLIQILLWSNKIKNLITKISNDNTQTHLLKQKIITLKTQTYTHLAHM